MQIRSTIAFYNQGTNYSEKKFTFRYGKSRENYLIFSRAYQQKFRTFKDFPGQQKNPGLFQDVATLSIVALCYSLFRKVATFIRYFFYIFYCFRFYFFLKIRYSQVWNDKKLYYFK